MVRLFFSIGPFAAMKISPIMSKFAKVWSAFCQIRNKLSTVCQKLPKLVNFCHSGEILPDLVTLIMIITVSEQKVAKYSLFHIVYFSQLWLFRSSFNICLKARRRKQISELVKRSICNSIELPLAELHSSRPLLIYFRSFRTILQKKLKTSVGFKLGLSDQKVSMLTDGPPPRPCYLILFVPIIRHRRNPGPT